MKKLFILMLVFSFTMISSASALMVAVPEIKLEYKLQNKVDSIFINIEKKISNRDVIYKEWVYNKIIDKVWLIYKKYPNLSGKSLLLMQYIENKANSQKENFLINNVFDWIYDDEVIIKDEVSKSDELEYVLWNKDAQISFIEYSDIECPFCARLHNAWTIEEVLEKYDWKVNFKFKHFPLDFHKKAKTLALASECAWEQGWSDKYYDFIFKAFKNHDDIQWEYYISDIVKNIWINKEKFDTCLKSEKYSDKIDKQMKEWTDLWVTWTPWNIIMNNSTWDYKIISWAYPTKSFVEVIDKMLK